MSGAGPKSDTREQILNIAERGYRRGGFAGLSFRDIAAELSIKSASVHYHFPHKEDLGKAVVNRYADNFLKGLGAPDDVEEDRNIRMIRLAEAYKTAYAEGESSCLCAVLGSVGPDLPKAVQKAVNEFFERLLQWTRIAREDDNTEQVSHMIAALQGAMILSVATGKDEYLEQVVKHLTDSVHEQ